MLGEDRQWGHAYYLFPAVLQIPLMIRVPHSIAERAMVDLDAISFSTDITPTLYTILGYAPVAQDLLGGRPLIGVKASEVIARRRATEVVAASYGAVWGALKQNGRRLYIVDANHGKEYAYEHAPRGPWHPIDVTDGMRVVNQQAIRQHVEEIARVYRLKSPVNR
jgi:arylsulfatase A-like enzyme